jgi:hypothetical protein
VVVSGARASLREAAVGVVEALRSAITRFLDTVTPDEAQPSSPLRDMILMDRKTL